MTGGGDGVLSKKEKTYMDNSVMIVGWGIKGVLEKIQQKYKLKNEQKIKQ